MSVAHDTTRISHSQEAIHAPRRFVVSPGSGSRKPAPKRPHPLAVLFAERVRYAFTEHRYRMAVARRSYAQQNLADDVGAIVGETFTQSAVSLWMNAERPSVPGVHIIAALGEVLQCSPAWLLGWSEEGAPIPIDAGVFDVPAPPVPKIDPVAYKRPAAKKAAGSGKRRA